VCGAHDWARWRRESKAWYYFEQPVAWITSMFAG
jgi:hypothetical protein